MSLPISPIDPAESHYKYCPSCSLVYLVTSNFCRQCGQNLLPLESTRRCPHCQQEHRLQARFCSFTGLPVPPLEAVPGVDWPPAAAPYDAEAAAGSTGTAAQPEPGHAPPTVPAPEGPPPPDEWEILFPTPLTAPSVPTHKATGANQAEAGPAEDFTLKTGDSSGAPPTIPGGWQSPPSGAVPPVPAPNPAGDPDTLDSHNAPTRRISHLPAGLEPPQQPAIPPPPAPPPESPGPVSHPFDARTLPAPAIRPQSSPVTPAPQGEAEPTDSHNAPTRKISHLPSELEPPAAPPAESFDSHCAPTRKIDRLPPGLEAPLPQPPDTSPRKEEASLPPSPAQPQPPAEPFDSHNAPTRKIDRLPPGLEQAGASPAAPPPAAPGAGSSQGTPTPAHAPADSPGGSTPPAAPPDPAKDGPPDAWEYPPDAPTRRLG